MRSNTTFALNWLRFWIIEFTINVIIITTTECRLNSTSNYFCRKYLVIYCHKCVIELTSDIMVCVVKEFESTNIANMSGVEYLRYFCHKLQYMGLSLHSLTIFGNHSTNSSQNSSITSPTKLIAFAHTLGRSLSLSLSALPYNPGFSGLESVDCELTINSCFHFYKSFRTKKVFNVWNSKPVHQRRRWKEIRLKGLGDGLSSNPSESGKT